MAFLVSCRASKVMTPRKALDWFSTHRTLRPGIAGSLSEVATAALNPSASWALFKEAGSAWVADNAPTFGAALAYYTAFSLAPVLIVVIAVAGLVFGRQAAEGDILHEIQGLVGPAGAATIQTVIRHAAHPAAGIIASIGALATVVAGASGAFLQLQDVLNLIWKVKPKPESFWRCTLRKRWLSFGLVLATGFLLLVSLALSAAL